jgi:hypothetical protein
MTSNVNYLSINENFPVAGQDNDTQVFRDNFDTIKNSLRAAQEEITDLQNNTAKLNEDNEFSNSVIINAVLQQTTERRVDGGAISTELAAPVSIDFENGSYQLYRFGVDADLEFVNFPTNANPLLTAGVGRATLELRSTGSEVTLTLYSPGGEWRANGFPLAKIGVDRQPLVLPADSNENPIFIEVWKHSNDFTYIRYLGQFV